jgi:hypothetical protein
MKNEYERNIKVNMNEVNEGEERRSSTTLNYGICDYCFGKVLFPELADNARNDKRYRDPKTRYRQWLVAQVTSWAKTQKQARSDVLERALLDIIYTEGYAQGLAKNKNNNGLDV